MATTKTASQDVATAGSNGKSKKLVAFVLAGAIMAGGTYFLLRPEPETKPVAGEIETLEAIQLNLAGEHYLRVSLALQLTEETAEIDGSKALDATIAKFSGMPLETVNDTKKRTALKKELGSEISELYDGEVMGLYFAEFVTQ